MAGFEVIPEEVPVEIYSIALMTNHFHLVVRPPTTESLPDFMQCLNQRYAQTRNGARGGSGKLFEREYAAIPILDERQLALTLAYVELNPVRAGLPEKSHKHQWTTYWNHTRAEKQSISRRLWTPCDWYRELGSTAAKRATRYAEWVRYCLESGEKPINAAALEALEWRYVTKQKRERRPNGRSAR